MPVPYHRTNKGRAEGYIRTHAHKPLTVDMVHEATGLPRSAIRAAFLELTYNNVLYRTGPKSRSVYQYQEWKIETLRREQERSE